jgi:hypothetical protein
MNERIRELFEKHTVPNFGADADTVRNQKGEYRTPMIEDHWQTFQEAAELIVGECVTQLELVRKYRYDRIQPLETQQTIIDECQYQIKQHFGVEE